MAKQAFQTEVAQLLHLIIHSLYSNKEIFLRELVSNASDALDKLKYLTLTDDAYKGIAFDPRIDISFDGKNQKTLTISDTGIGMNEEELAGNLGTIARSGTRSFLEKLSGDAKKDSNLIGQFGVGFYSSFMAADRVEVLSRKAGEQKAWLWTSDGKGEFEVGPAERPGHGTTVTLFLNDEGREFASQWRIESLVKKYSNHIAFPIFLSYDKKEYDDKGKEKKSSPVTERINTASALWKRPKSEITDADYAEFYKTISRDTDDPLLTIHTRAEGTMEYTTLFFIPKHAPFDLYNVDYRPGVKLYIKRVFITDDDKELMPTYLRFLRGVIDSEDLPLNVSREILQQNRVLVNIRSASVKKVLGELQRLATEDKEKYTAFVTEFNRPLKEGLYSDFANREALLELVRFKSTRVEGFTSLEEYKQRMIAGQKAIYFITGDNEAKLRNSPLLEAYAKKDIEVLIMDDEIDEIVIPSVDKYKDIELKGVNRSDAGEDLGKDKEKDKDKDMAGVIEKIKKALGDRVKDVRVSVRLAESPSCIVTDESDPTFKMAAMLKAMGQKQMTELKPILELNPNHEIIGKLKNVDDNNVVEDLSFLLLDQALLMEGVELKDPAAFVKRLNRVISKVV